MNHDDINTVGTCLDCKRLMVPTTIKATHRPKGMVRHHGKGLCDGCRSRRQREAAHEAAHAIYGNHDTRWMVNGECAKTGWPDAWFPDNGTNARGAKAVCNGDQDGGIPPCPVRDQCLAYALATHQPDGIWGGLSRTERQALRRRKAAS